MAAMQICGVSEMLVVRFEIFTTAFKIKKPTDVTILILCTYRRIEIVTSVGFSILYVEKMHGTKSLKFDNGIVENINIENILLVSLISNSESSCDLFICSLFN
jgi:hypothetical protein